MCVWSLQQEIQTTGTVVWLGFFPLKKQKPNQTVVWLGFFLGKKKKNSASAGMKHCLQTVLLHRHHVSRHVWRNGREHSTSVL